MAHLVGDIAKYFKFEEIDIDNSVFKLFNPVCVIIFFTGSMVGVMSQYFGEPINCDFKGIDGEMASDYCWIHGSSYIPPEHQVHMKCIVDLEGIESEDDAPDTSYYQWVTFFLLFQAGLFILPGKLWKIMEGGMIESFGLEGKQMILLTEDAKYDEAVTMEAVVEKYVKYFRSTLHHNNLYFFKFVVCEFLNVAMLYFNFYLTDTFLQGRFKYYGWDVMMFYQKSRREQKVSVNPFCAAFPTEVSCSVPNIGAAGSGQSHNGLCVLSQNIINEKMYLAIWFWLVFLIIISIPLIMFRLCTILFDYFRFALLASAAGPTNDAEVRKSIKAVMTKCYVGDWFVLNQLSKNVTPYFFRSFVKELRAEMRERPKRSHSKKSTASANTTLPLKKSGKKGSAPTINHIPFKQPEPPPPMAPAAPALESLLDDAPSRAENRNLLSAEDV